MTDGKVPAEDLESSRTAVALRLRKLLELGGIVDAVVTNEEWLYMLTEETRNSLSIEGHFATEKQLKDVIQGRRTAPEILNYFRTAQTAYDYALQLHRESDAITPELAYVRHIHSELFRGLDEARGRLRAGGITIQGASVAPPNGDIEAYVRTFLLLVPIELRQDTLVRGLARLHALFESIHPFGDGNGRVGRILLNYLAVGSGYPPITIKGIRQEDRAAYYDALQRADQGFHKGFPEPSVEALRGGLDRGDSTALEKMLLASLSENLDRTLVAAAETREPLVDLGTIAEDLGISEASVRKRVQRGQLPAVRRGRKLKSHRLLSLVDDGLAPGTPTDVLPLPIELQAHQPCLNLDSFQTTSNTPDRRFKLEWRIRNIGAGVARRIAIFMPGLMIDHPEQPIEAGGELRRDVFYEDKHAFVELMRPPVQIVAELEDHAGNLYRQYGHVVQERAPSGAFYFYNVEELTKPYRVRARIVPAEY